MLSMMLDLQSLFEFAVHSCTHWLWPRRPQPPPPLPGLWAHIRWRYWSAKINDISLWPPGVKRWIFIWKKYFLYMRWLFFCFNILIACCRKNLSKNVRFLLWNLPILEILSVTLFRDPTVEILSLKMHTDTTCYPGKSYTKKANVTRKCLPIATASIETNHRKPWEQSVHTHRELLL